MNNKITIWVNGVKFERSKGESVKSLIYDLKYQLPHIAVAVNRQCIKRSMFDESILEDGDKVEILSPMAGG